ncbi:Ribonuclease/ribotoxin [Mycena capillaripes]|nr:Ribonuclease/ribotoxin [Mycena capillaripes]
MFPTRAMLTALVLAPLALATPTLGPTGPVTCGNAVYTSSQVNYAVQMGQRRIGGGGEYPHIFNNFQDLPLHRDCRVSGRVYEYPLKAGAGFTGGDPGPDRVVFAAAGSYCGVVTHTGAAGNNFISCRGA